MRGFLGGAATGLVLSALAVGTVSVLSEAPAGNTPPAPPQQSAPQVAGPTSSDPAPAAPVSGPGEGEGPSLAPAPDVSAPQVTSLGDGQALQADTSVPEGPDAVALDGGLTAPQPGADGSVALGSDTQVLPNPLAPPPASPDSEADIVLSTEPAAPPAAILVEEDAPADAGAEGDSPQEAGAEDGLLVVDLGADGTPAVVLDSPGAAPDSAAPATDEADAPDAAEAGAAADADAAEAAADPAPDAAEETAQEAAQPEAVVPDAEADESSAAAPAQEEAAPRIALQGEGASLPTGGNPGVVIRRPGVEAEADPESFDLGQPLGALELYAAEIPEPGPAPRLSVILIDDGAMPQAAAALDGVPFPVTIAVDPAVEGAAQTLQDYRARGFEVAVLARLPEGAAPQDVEITFEALFASFPETIAVLDTGDGGYQGARDVTQQAMLRLAADGRGFVTASAGLNTALREAASAGVPAATIYRDLDAEDQEARIIRRFIDQAAFRARQESGVVLVGRMRPDTLSALILWGATDRAEQVALVPLSRVLLGQ